MTAFWCAQAVLDGVAHRAVRILEGAGRIVAVETDVAARPGDVRLGLVAPGFANAHSHLFHRALRGRTHDDGGDFWRWRTEMYRVAGALEPDSYRALAAAVFAEMRAAGVTAVGEFHYVHHRPDGAPYPDHAMERAVADAAEAVGIRLVLLDTAYFTSAIGVPALPEQRRFGDGGAAAWLDRWHRLRAALGGRDLVTLGAAIHSVRAVPEADVARIAAELPPEVPLHVHLSEQPRENEECLAATGLTPTGLLARAGALGRRLSVVHATHLTEADRDLLGEAGVVVVMCPSTEADLGDGIGPARALQDRGADVAIGSDQNAVVDPFLELRGLEAGERLQRRARGVFPPAALWHAGGAAGYRSLGLDGGGIRVGALCDLVELDAASPRTAGVPAAALPLAATAADVRATVVGGVLRPAVDPVPLLLDALAALDVPAAALPIPEHR